MHQFTFGKGKSGGEKANPRVLGARGVLRGCGVQGSDCRSSGELQRNVGTSTQLQGTHRNAFPGEHLPFFHPYIFFVKINPSDHGSIGGQRDLHCSHISMESARDSFLLLKSF